MRRGSLFWGSLLLLLGGLMLADAAGVRLPNGNSLMSLFWPLLLIGAGGWTLLGVFLRGKVETETANIPLEDARTASVSINHGAGELNLHSGAAGNELLHGSFTGGLEYKTSRSGDNLEVRMRPARDFVGFPFFGFRTQLDWDIAFNPSIPAALDLNLGANKSTINLRDLRITDVKLKSGASETTLTLPSTGRLKADFEIGAASLTLIVPEGVSIRVRAAIGAGDINVDRARFPRDESPDFETASNAVDINIKGGACSVKVR
ncbi:MAG: hypothetical protein DPW18_19140 [Chloroflexi bacterium]|nr:hypothetical protein [Chloroflexota bacterium]MDL1944558.1 hypothetical protein [Chloroflexi bacterium CFX2]